VWHLGLLLSTAPTMASRAAPPADPPLSTCSWRLGTDFKVERGDAQSVRLKRHGKLERRGTKVVLAVDGGGTLILSCSEMADQLIGKRGTLETEMGLGQEEVMAFTFKNQQGQVLLGQVDPVTQARLGRFEFKVDPNGPAFHRSGRVFPRRPP